MNPDQTAAESTPPSRASTARLAAGACAAFAAALALWAGSPAALDPQALAGLAAGAGAAALAVAAAARRRGDAHRVRIAAESAQRARATEAAAIGARELWRVLDAMPVHVARYDRELRLRYANRLHRRFFGIDDDRDLRGEPLAEMIGADTFAFVRPYFEQALAGTPARYERRVQAPSGERWIQVWLMPDTGLSGDGIDGVLVASADITERRLAEQRVEAGLRMLSSTVEHLPMGVSVVDGELRVAAFNDAFLRLHDLEDVGVRPGDRLDRVYRTLALRGDYGPGDPDALAAARMALAGEGRALRFERARPDGRVLEVFRSPFPGGGFVTLYTDVTERKAAEQHLVEARERAEAAVRTKSEFIAALGRDVRAPLNGVLGLADLLLQSRLEPAQRRHVEWLQGSARTLLATLANLVEHAGAAEAPAATGPAVAMPATPGVHAAPARARLLVVEDCPVTREVTRLLLERHGLEVDEAQDGPEALARCTQRRYDLVLMDVELPGLDGIAATRALRALDAAGSPRTPVIALTGSTQARTRSECLAAGMDGFVVKPVEPRTLLATIAPFLPAAARARAEARAGAPAVDPAVFDALCELMGEGLPDLVAAYAASARAHLAALRAALAREDAAAMMRPAHTLKSSSANLGASALTALAGQLEAQARAGRIEGAAALVDRVDAALQRVCDEIGAPRARVAEAIDGSR